MSGTFGLTLRSLANRRGTVALTVGAIAISVALLSGVQKLREGAREGFTSTVSGVDLIVGARSGAVNLLLYSVFRVGDATANVSWDSYQLIAKHRDVAWTIPLSLGDSHRGFRVLGTTDAYFAQYRVAGGQALAFAQGAPFADEHDVVLGAAVAEELGYTVGTPLRIAHGAADVSFAEHDDDFHVVGVLAPTGTPVDRTVHVSLDAMNALHQGALADGAAPPGITAFMVGMRDRSALLTMQRAINEYPREPLLAILPGVALKQLWDVIGVADRALLVVAAFVVAAGLLGMLTSILVSLNERRREMAILRSVGAGPRHVFAMLVGEAGVLAGLGVLAGIALTYGLLFVARPWLAARYGIFPALDGLSRTDFVIPGSVILCALLIGLVPAWRAYRNTLADGLTARL